MKTNSQALETIKEAEHKGQFSEKLNKGEKCTTKFQHGNQLTLSV